MKDERTRQRKLRALEEAKAELKAERLTVITDDQESTLHVKFSGGRGETNVIPLWKWLITPNL